MQGVGAEKAMGAGVEPLEGEELETVLLQGCGRPGCWEALLACIGAYAPLGGGAGGGMGSL